MANWKTTLFGLVAALPMIGKIVFPPLGVVWDAVGALGMALTGYFASDKK